jgi:hypothetical protein
VCWMFQCADAECAGIDMVAKFADKLAVLISTNESCMLKLGNGDRLCTESEIR